MKIFITVCLLVLSLSFNADAEQKKQLGNWDVHYIAFPAPLLTPEIAQQYKLQRSKYNGVINISVLDTESKQAQQVTISGIAKDLQGRQRTLEFTEVTEGSAVYYLAQLPFRHEQRFTFTISISNSSETQQLMFDQTFYVD
ncbi:DUF4426 domain-containing protein [Rheinheimera baltica]|uniref:DUF4426 domain-containing protein n=1 Tax=Rheinheimera baltica TaxID=67576 RepID=A0ABT9HU59_9GAMM|nr:DUF4426 domain-containing protein [Rheinheimera baltica]MDP5134538.1 DUF4426 domain-containing protein [Rheinheimera baltica]MDP5141363.1 DUF4426 domain-containing protein [Rheinheimera baltica]MDP5189609.1 DUF4426 domain-containing protein [Rheinheimera baltica]